MRETVAEVVLPSGLFTDAGHQRSALVRALNGEDEAAVGAIDVPAALGDELLRRCVLRIGELNLGEPNRGDPRAPGVEILDLLTLGDREALLLHLRALSYGERLDAQAHCPRCSAPMDLELGTAQLLLEPYANPRPAYELELAGHAVLLRVPTRADQIAAASVADSVAELLRRCVGVHAANEVHSPAPDGDVPDRDVGDVGDDDMGNVPEAVVALVPGIMQELDPQAELQLNLTCPECETGFSSVLDMAGYLFEEAGSRADALFGQVNALALGYHWSEAEILALPHPRRQLYLGLLAQSMDAGVSP